MSSGETRIAHDDRMISLVWPGGSVSELTAEVLRANCRSAPAVRDRLDRMATPDHSGVTITAVRQIGVYGLNIQFSDGHDRGIYPWDYLRELAARRTATVSDFIDG